MWVINKCLHMNYYEICTHKHFLELLHCLISHTNAVDLPDLISNMQST